MGKIHKSETGFSAIEAILIVIIVIILSFVSMYVYNANNNSNETLNAASKISTSAAPKTKNTTGLTKVDKVNIVDTVLKYCQQNNPGKRLKVMPVTNLDDPKQTRVKDNFVISNLYCYDNSLSEDSQGSGSDYLLKKIGSKWTVIDADQMSPACTKVDGNGIPAGFIQCYDANNQPRNPV